MRRVANKSTLRLEPRAPRRSGAAAFPAWIESEDRAMPVAANVVMPRVRDGLVLRTVAKGRGAKRPADHGNGR
jgi:hypothetical protein